MNRLKLWLITASIVTSVFATQSVAELRRDAGSGAQASKKAQYMVRQLHNEKQELQAKLAELQAKFDSLSKEHEKAQKSLEKSSANNDKLVSRVKGDIEKYQQLADKYRDAVSILRKSNLDNQYMVRAVQEREQWIAQCTGRNDQLFEANNDLLSKYGEYAIADSEPVFGTGIVELENEMQDYQFKLEDLQVTRFKPSVDVDAHAKERGEAHLSEKDEVEPVKKTTVN